MTSYQRAKRRADEAERLLARLRVDLLTLAIEVDRIGASARPEPRAIALRVVGKTPRKPAQLRLAP